MYAVKLINVGDDCFQPCDPEELEPYASYMQRVNSIYNSSADLFKAWITLDLRECTKTFLIKCRSRMCLRMCVPSWGLHRVNADSSVHTYSSGWNYTRVLILLLMRDDETPSKEHSTMCRLWWEKYKAEWVKMKEGVENRRIVS